MMSDSSFSSFYSPVLPEGGTIGVVSPSRWAEPARIIELKTRLEGEGYRVIIHPQNELRDGWLAGSDEAKVAALMEMFVDPSIDAIMCTRGGAGASRLLDRLDYDLIRQNPKPFIGYSDVTCLLHAITRKTGMITYHGAMGWREDRFDPRTLADLLYVVGAAPKEKQLVFPQATVVREGNVSGPLVGGNMMLLQSLVGTPYDLCLQDSILFIEEIDEPLYVLDRILTHLRLSGRFKGVNAVIVGDMCLIEGEHPDPNAPPEAWYGKTIEEIVKSNVPATIPLAFNVPCGHADYVTTFPIGAMVDVTFAPSNVSVTFAP